jgi:mannose-6-phosphate isomerase-like protein (cupin superfamily)
VEILYGEVGTITVVDAFGLSAPVGPGAQATLNEGSLYTLRNTGSSSASLLRVSLGAAGSPSSDVEILVESPLSPSPTLPATLLLAHSTWQPEADTGVFTVPGPFGFVVISGALAVNSPSGLEAILGSNQGVVFPADVAQRERNPSAEAATAFLITLAPVGRPIVSPVLTATPGP